MKRFLLSALLAFVLQWGFSQSFQQLTTVGTSQSTQDVSLGDIDNDGDLDVIVANLNDGSGYYLNNGDGTFSTITNLTATSGLRATSLQDVEGDGDLDYLLGNDIQTDVLINDGTGTAPSGLTRAFGLLNITNESVDLNGDGKLDVLLSHTAGLTLLQNVSTTNTPDFSVVTPTLTNGSIADVHTRHAVAADMDGDGDMDILQATLNNKMIIWEATGPFTYTLAVVSGSVNPLDTRRVAVADFDRDGILDFVSAHRANNTGNTGITNIISYGKGGTLSSGSSNFDEVALPIADESRDVEVLDYNDDGLPDILSVGDAGVATLFRNDGSRSFSVEQTFTVGTQQRDMFDAAVGDLDGDGIDDIYFTVNGGPDEVWKGLPPTFTTTLSSTENDPTSNDSFQVTLSAASSMTAPSPDDFQLTNTVIDSIWTENFQVPGTINATLGNQIAIDNQGKLYYIDGNNLPSSVDLVQYEGSVSTQTTIQTFTSGTSLEFANLEVSKDNILHALVLDYGTNPPPASILRYDINNSFNQLSTIPLASFVSPPVNFSISSDNNIVFAADSKIYVIDENGAILDNSITSGSLGYLFFDNQDRIISLYPVSGGTRLRVYDPSNYSMLFETIQTNVPLGVAAIDNDNNIYMSDGNSTDGIYKIDYQNENFQKVASAEYKVNGVDYFIFDINVNKSGEFVMLTERIGGGNGSNIFKLDQANIQIKVSPIQQGLSKIKLNANTIKNVDKEINLESNEFSITYDATPEVAITSAAVAPAAAPFEVNIDFTEPMTGFELSDITISGGTLSEFTEVTTGQNFTVLVTPSVSGTITLDIAAGVADDANNNPNLAAAPFTISADPISTAEAFTDPTCYDGRGVVEVTVSGGTSPYSYRYTGPNNSSGPNFIPSSTLFTDMIPGDTYTLEVKDANGYVFSKQIGPISQPDEITFNTTLTDPECNGFSNGVIDINATGGTGAFEYTIDGGITFQTASDFNGLSAGSYDVGVRDANGCLTLPYTTVTLIDPATPLTPSLSDGGATFFYGTGTNVTITKGNGDTSTSHFKITNISGCEVFDQNGSVISEGVFTTSSVLEVVPNEAAAFSFDVQASASDKTTCLGGNIVSYSGTASKAPLSVRANDVTITEEDPIPSSFALTYSGFVNGEDETVIDTKPTASTTATAGSVGTYDIVVTGGSDDNYDLQLTDGTLSIEEVLSALEAAGISIYPNPVSDVLTVDTKRKKLKSLQLLDLGGRVVIDQKSVSLDLSNLNGGTYILQIEDQDGKRSSHRIIKR